MLQNMAASGLANFNPANLHPNEMSSIIYYCKSTGGCSSGPKASNKTNSYDASKLSAHQIIKTYNYCKSIGVPYCQAFTMS